MAPSISPNNNIDALPRAFIAMVNEGNAMKAKCRSIKHIDYALMKYDKWLLDQGLPSIKTAIVALHFPKNDVSETLQGALNYLFLPNNSFSIPITIVSNEDYEQLKTTIARVTGAATSIVVHANYQERGSWNTVLFSGWYQAFLWIAFIINVSFILHALWRLTIVWKSGVFRHGIRTAAFIIALCSVILVLVSVPIYGSPYYEIIARAGLLLFNVALYLVLIIWSSLDSSMNNRKSTKTVKLGIHVVFAIILLVLLSNCILPFIARFNRMYAEKHLTIRLVTSVLQMVSGLFFLYFGIKFYITSKTCLTPLNRRTLLQLSLISVILCIAIILICLDPILKFSRKDFSNYYSTATIRTTLNIIGLTGQSASLLYMLGIRMPSDSTTIPLAVMASLKNILPTLRQKMSKSAHTHKHQLTALSNDNSANVKSIKHITSESSIASYPDNMV
ncbi:hypothetical protein BDF19DRAFT_474868 [Syncephalis fuscata]|nr:hypothetical protein BDF19DRAFT_474868 [Syncephalis fuscata]